MSGAPRDPRLSEASPAELIEAGLAAMGWSAGQWSIELVVRDGAIEKVFAKASSGRSALLKGPDEPAPPRAA